MRVAAGGHGRKPHLAEQALDLCVPLFSSSDPLYNEGLRDEIGHVHLRIERGVRILEHHLELTPLTPALSAARRGEIASVEDDGARSRFLHSDGQTSRR
jgi:hypothetical protein